MGDTDLHSCIGTAGAITPVPGGVALLTTAMLMLNTVKSMVLQEGIVEQYNEMAEMPLVRDAYPHLCCHLLEQMSERSFQKRYCDSEEWQERYSRQIRLDEVGLDGQVRNHCSLFPFRKS